MRILDWPASERPRERLLNQGPGALSDAELIALFVGQGLPGCNAVDLARQWLESSGGLRALLTQDQCEFTELAGAGVARFVILQAALELGKRYLHEDLCRQSVLDSPTSVARYLQIELAHETREHFGCLFLDTQHQVIAWRVLFSGTLNAAAVYPRVVVEQALKLGAGSVILAHNHPSGSCKASQADRHMTQRIADALALIDIPVLDHLIITNHTTLSFAERGWLP